MSATANRSDRSAEHVLREAIIAVTGPHRELVHNDDGALYLIEQDAIGYGVWACLLAPVNHYDTLDAAIDAAATDPYPHDTRPRH